ncbi:MAG: type I methionyl aminopeptidase [Bacteroidetes bacterium]|nr:type I methionyl aminopeptidase [Bacteroidota bacterium]
MAGSLEKNEQEIEFLRENAILVSKTLAEVARCIKPGVKTSILDQVAETYIRDHGAVPGFKGYQGYPATLCISVNDEVVHGIPGERVLLNGDIVSIDCGTKKNGYYGDSAYTFEVGEVAPDIKALLDHTKASLFRGIEAALAGKRVGDISRAVQGYVETKGYSVVRDLVGHGLGMELHEKPEIPNYGKRGTGMKLREGMVLCIEPMINLGTRNITHGSDGWTIRTADGKPSAHFELTVVVRKDRAEMLSTFRFIEETMVSNI